MKREEHLMLIEKAKKELKLAKSKRRKHDCKKHLYRLNVQLFQYDKLQREALQRG